MSFSCRQFDNIRLSKFSIPSFNQCLISLPVSLDLSELEKDPDLKLKEDEPEAWSVTVEKRMLKKMNKKDIKRQDNIFGM